jgi:hypothetical protein
MSQLLVKKYVEYDGNWHKILKNEKIKETKWDKKKLQRHVSYLKKMINSSKKSSQLRSKIFQELDKECVDSFIGLVEKDHVDGVNDGDDEPITSKKRKHEEPLKIALRKRQKPSSPPVDVQPLSQLYSNDDGGAEDIVSAVDALPQTDEVEPTQQYLNEDGNNDESSSISDDTYDDQSSESNNDNDDSGLEKPSHSKKTDERREALLQTGMLCLSFH